VFSALRTHLRTAAQDLQSLLARSASVLTAAKSVTSRQTKSAYTTAAPSPLRRTMDSLLPLTSPSRSLQLAHSTPPLFSHLDSFLPPPHTTRFCCYSRASKTRLPPYYSISYKPHLLTICTPLPYSGLICHQSSTVFPKANNFDSATGFALF